MQAIKTYPERLYYRPWQQAVLVDSAQCGGYTITPSNTPLLTLHTLNGNLKFLSLVYQFDSQVSLKSPMPKLHLQMILISLYLEKKRRKKSKKNSTV